MEIPTDKCVNKLLKCWLKICKGCSVKNASQKGSADKLKRLKIQVEKKVEWLLFHKTQTITYHLLGWAGGPWACACCIDPSVNWGY